MSHRRLSIHRGRFVASYTILLLVVVAAAFGTIALNGSGADGAEASRCTEQIPTGRSISTAWDTTELFVADVILKRKPACGYELSTTRLRGKHSRAQWAIGNSPVRPFPTRYAPVPITRASRNPAVRQAVYMLSRRVSEFVVAGAGGRPEIPMMVGLAAPDAGLGAYDLVLVVENGSWRVDRAWRVRLSP